MKGTAYNLNLARTYLPQWGAWEVAREIICNAIDADPDFVAESASPDRLKVSTSTTPSIAEMLVIGHGSKGPGADTIGQFGEGLKMAALAATRAGGRLTLRDASHTVTFGFESTLGVDSLVAHLGEPEVESGFEADIEMPMVGTIYRDRIIAGLNEGPFRLAAQGHTQVFVKGVYITTIGGGSVWDWNFTSQMSLNRDRSMVSDFDVSWAVAQWFGSYITDDHARAILTHSEGSLERKAMQYAKTYNRVLTALRKAFVGVYGEKAVLSNGSDADTAARALGYNTIPINPPEFREVLVHAGIRLSDAVAEVRHRLDAADHTPYQNAIAELRRLDRYINAPNATVRVFSGDVSQMGLADTDEMVIWLNESLFLNGCERDRVATYLHEMAHIMSGAADETRRFESALDSIAASFALEVLGVSK